MELLVRESVCQLVRQFVSQQGVANSLCAKLDAASAAAKRGQTNAAQNIMAAFVHEVEAQEGKHIPADKADVLVRLAQSL